jgi:hypothetical protein
MSPMGHSLPNSIVQLSSLPNRRPARASQTAMNAISGIVAHTAALAIDPSANYASNLRT